MKSVSSTESVIEPPVSHSISVDFDSLFLIDPLPQSDDTDSMENEKVSWHNKYCLRILPLVQSTVFFLTHLPIPHNRMVPGLIEGFLVAYPVKRPRRPATNTVHL